MRLRNISVNFCLRFKNKMLAYRNVAAKVGSKYHYFYALIFIIYFCIYTPTKIIFASDTRMLFNIVFIQLLPRLQSWITLSTVRGFRGHRTLCVSVSGKILSNMQSIYIFGLQVFCNIFFAKCLWALNRINFLYTGFQKQQTRHYTR